MKIAIVRGKYLNNYEMQSYEPLVTEHEIVGFASKRPLGRDFSFEVKNLFSLLDLPNFPFKMPILNRIFVDAHFLVGLEKHLAGFDIVHAAETYFGFSRQCLMAKDRGLVKKLVITCWENISFANEGIWGRRGTKKMIIEEADLFIAVSKKAKRVLELEGAEPKKIIVINPGINIKRFFPKQRAGRKIRFLFTGRLEEEKGVYDILQAIRLLVFDDEIKKNNLEFCFYGLGSKKKKIEALEGELGIKKYVKHDKVSYEKMPGVYQKTDIFWAPSKATKNWQEQWSMVLLEAQASGLPIITTKCGSIEENVGNSCLYVDEGDFYGLYIAAKKLILDEKLRKKLGLLARKRVEMYFDNKKIAKKISRAYKNLGIK